MVSYDLETGKCTLSTLGVREDNWAVNGMAFASTPGQSNTESLYLMASAAYYTEQEQSAEIGIVEDGDITSTALNSQHIPYGELSRGSQNTMWLMAPSIAETNHSPEAYRQLVSHLGLRGTQVSWQLSRFDTDTLDSHETHSIDLGQFGAFAVTQRLGKLYIFTSPFVDRSHFLNTRYWRSENCTGLEWDEFCFEYCESDVECGPFATCMDEFDVHPPACAGWGESSIHTFDEQTGELTALTPTYSDGWSEESGNTRRTAPITVVGAGPLGCPEE